MGGCQNDKIIRAKAPDRLESLFLRSGAFALLW